MLNLSWNRVLVPRQFGAASYVARGRADRQYRLDIDSIAGSAPDLRRIASVGAIRAAKVGTSRNGEIKSRDCAWLAPAGKEYSMTVTRIAQA
jgi:hypothetical protein